MIIKSMFTESESKSESKSELRKKILSERRKLDKIFAAHLSKEICARVISMDLYKFAQDICLYMPINNEADASLLIDASINLGKNIWLPRVHGDTMDFYYYDRNVILDEGSYGIQEPQSDRSLVPDPKTLIIMPGAVFSVKCDRIGYGGGYYDKYLSKYPMCKTVAICYDFQILQEIPADEHDIKPLYIVSERNTYSAALK